jgi:uncharacterized OsmC-like protein
MSQGTGSEVAPQVIYRSHVSVEAKLGGIKLISLPAESAPVPMGMHGAIAKHYKLAEGAFTPHASTLDYVVGATAGCLTGTLARALMANKIPVGDGRLQVEAIGELEAEDGVLVIRRIQVLAHLKAEASQRELAQQTVSQYAMKCPVYRSLYKAIEITTDLDFLPINPAGYGDTGCKR